MAVAFHTGDIVMVDFSPTLGHEQSGRRPALIVSDNDYTQATGLYILCPITTTNRPWKTRVELSSDLQTTGFIICEQFRTMDLSCRNPRYIEQIPSDLLDEVLERIAGAFPDMYYDPEQFS